MNRILLYWKKLCGWKRYLPMLLTLLMIVLVNRVVCYAVHRFSEEKYHLFIFLLFLVLLLGGFIFLEYDSIRGPGRIRIIRKTVGEPSYIAPINIHDAIQAHH